MSNLGRALALLLSTRVCLSELVIDDKVGRIVDLNNRIVGGEDVPNEEYPWFVKFNGCGGSLISPQHVLTAGACCRFRGL